MLLNLQNYQELFRYVFQLLFSNTQASDEAGVLTGAEGDWLKGDVFFGFNILRVF